MKFLADRERPASPPPASRPRTGSSRATPAGPGSPWYDPFGRSALRAGQALLLAAAAALVVIVMVRLRVLVVPVLIAIMIAAAVSPLVGALARRKVPRALATWIALITGLGVLAAVVMFVAAGVRNEWDELRDGAVEGLEELERFLLEGPLPVDQAQLERVRESATELLSGDQVRTGALSGATVAAEAVAGLFLGFVVLYFLLKDGERIWAFLLRPFDGERHERAQRIGERSVAVLGGYVRGTAIVALVDAVLIGAALFILQVPLALPLAIVVFVGAFIPIVGATVSGALAALIALVGNGPITALIVIGVVVAVVQLEGDVLSPIVLGKALSLHPLAILLALTAGTILAGVIGALLSVPLAAVAWTAVTAWSVETSGQTPDGTQTDAHGDPVAT